MAEVWNVFDPDNPVYVQVAERRALAELLNEERLLWLSLLGIFCTPTEVTFLVSSADQLISLE